jgi:plasmid maintenance system killer protein
VRSHANAKSWRQLQALPQDIRTQSYKAYATFKRDPSHPSLNFELIDRQAGIWSARINDNYRVLGVRDGGEITWFWIGTHREYEKLIRRR